MNLLRAIAQHYASLSGMIVPAERFTEGLRARHDTLPAITYAVSSEPNEYHQTGSSTVVTNVTFTIWASTPGQAGRIAEQLRNAFHMLIETTIGTDPDAVLVQFGRLDNRVDASQFTSDGGADDSHNATLYFVFRYRAPQPVRPDPINP